MARTGNVFLDNGEGDEHEYFVNMNNICGLTITAVGSFGGGTLELQITTDKINYTSLPGKSWTAATCSVVQYTDDMIFRLKLTGATNPALVVLLAS